MKVGERILYYNGGYSKADRDGTFTNVTRVTPTGRFKVEAAGDDQFKPDTLQRIRKPQFSGIRPYCVRLNDDSKKAEERAMRRLWISRIESFDLEAAHTETLTAMIGTINIDNKIR